MRGSLIAVCVIICLLSAGRSHGQVYSVSVIPAKVEKSMVAGSSITEGFRVANLGPAITNITIKAVDFQISEDCAPIYRTAGNNPKSAASWLVVTPA